MIVRNLDDAPAQIDAAISACVKHRKPVYIEVPCNLAGSPLPSAQPLSFPRSKECDRAALEAAVDAAAQMLSAAVKPVLLAGVKLRPLEATLAFRQLADAAGCAVATMANAKGFGNGWGTRVETEEELAAAIGKAIAHNGPSLIECIIDRDDCSKELLEWGVRVSAFNSH